MSGDPILTTAANLSRYHREHEKYYSEAPLHDAVELQRISRTLMALAERWAAAQPSEPRTLAPFAGAEDLNDERAIETLGVLFMEGGGAPAEMDGLRRRLVEMGEGYRRSGDWLGSAMETAWGTAEALLDRPGLADVLGERHRIISNDWLNASIAGVISHHLERAAAVLDRIDFSPASLRADLAGPRSAVGYLHSACELIDRASDLAAESATLVHDNERRWRVCAARIAEVEADRRDGDA